MGTSQHPGRVGRHIGMGTCRAPAAPVEQFHDISVFSELRQSDVRAAAIADLASTQHQLFTARQARDLGVSTATLSRDVACGRYDAMGGGLYGIAGVRMTWAREVMALVLRTGGWASHRTAARILGLDTYRRNRTVEVSVPHGRGSRSVVGRVHQTRAPDLAATSVINGIPCAGPARLLVDLTAVEPPFRLARAVDDIRRLRLVDDAALYESFLLHNVRGRPGIDKLGSALVEVMGTEVTDSTFEFLALQVFAEAGLPAPVVHFRVVELDGRLVAEVDLAYPSLKVAIELDGKAFHLNSVAYERDPRKRNRLNDLGWRVIVVTWSMLRDDPATVIRNVRTALDHQRKVLHALGELA